MEHVAFTVGFFLSGIFAISQLLAQASVWPRCVDQSLLQGRGKLPLMMMNGFENPEAIPGFCTMSIYVPNPQRPEQIRLVLSPW